MIVQTSGIGAIYELIVAYAALVTEDGALRMESLAVLADNKGVVEAVLLAGQKSHAFCFFPDFLICFVVFELNQTQGSDNRFF